MHCSQNLIAGLCFLGSSLAMAAPCTDLPSHEALTQALKDAVQDGNGGIFKPNAMWAAVVDRGGTVCVVAKVGDAWPGSRVIAVQKAATANGFSNDRLALSTANLFSAVQPGGSLFGLQHSNPVDATAAYRGSPQEFGSPSDPAVGQRLGGVNVFGGGLALYKDGHTVLGGIGVSGDSSCADHVISWKMRQKLGFDKIPGGLSPAKDDNIIFDLKNGKSKGGFGHPVCSPESQRLAGQLKIIRG